jgi:elongator complex protein 1
LQNDVASFEKELGDAIAEIWTKPQEDLVGAEEGAAAAPPPPDTWVSRMDELEKNRRVNAIERVPKPEMRRNDEWKMRLYSQ